MSPTGYNNYLNELMQNKRMLINGTGGANSAEVQGLRTNKLIHFGGEAQIRRDMFLNPRKYPRRNKAGNAFVASGDKSPNAPTITSITPTTDATSKLDAAVYDYCVVAVNKYGHKSAPQLTGGADVTIQANQKAVFALADAGSPAGQEATCFEIFRRDAASTNEKDFRYLFTEKVGNLIADVGQGIPDTSDMFLIEWSKEVLAYKQLLDLTLFPLATSVDAIRWMQRLYGTLMVKKPNRIIVFKNVGSEANA